MREDYTPWPDDNKPAQFEPMANAICEAIRFAYKLERQNQTNDIPWSGLNIGDSERATCAKPQEQLSVEMLAWVEEDQGREALDEIVGLAIRLGIEQGRRVFMNSTEYSMLKIRLDLIR